MPLFRGASSKVILASMPLRTVKAIYGEHAQKFAQASLGRNWDEAKERLRVIRNAGFAVTQGEVDPGMCGIAVPLFDPAGLIVGSLSIVIPIRHLTAKFLANAPQLLKQGTEQIHWALSLGTNESKPDRQSASTRQAPLGTARPNVARRTAREVRTGRAATKRVRA